MKECVNGKISHFIYFLFFLGFGPRSREFGEDDDNNNNKQRQSVVVFGLGPKKRADPDPLSLFLSV